MLVVFLLLHLLLLLFEWRDGVVGMHEELKNTRKREKAYKLMQFHRSFLLPS